MARIFNKFVTMPIDMQLDGIDFTIHYGEGTYFTFLFTLKGPSYHKDNPCFLKLWRGKLTFFLKKITSN